jgi:hypothetical protein
VETWPVLRYQAEAYTGATWTELWMYCGKGLCTVASSSSRCRADRGLVALGNHTYSVGGAVGVKLLFVHLKWRCIHVNWTIKGLRANTFTPRDNPVSTDS